VPQEPAFRSCPAQKWPRHGTERRAGPICYKMPVEESVPYPFLCCRRAWTWYRSPRYLQHPCELADAGFVAPFLLCFIDLSTLSPHMAANVLPSPSPSVRREVYRWRVTPHGCPDAVRGNAGAGPALVGNVKKPAARRGVRATDLPPLNRSRVCVRSGSKSGQVNTGRLQKQFFLTLSTATLDPQHKPGDSGQLFKPFLIRLQHDRSCQP
jgi:hypothetical protein